MSNNISRRVTLSSFNGTKSAPDGVKRGEDYWQLIGHSGTVVETGDSPIAPTQVRRVLVQFDVDPAALGLHCHNPIARALWIQQTDLVDEAQAILR